MANISVNNLTFCYEGSYDNIFENISFCIDTDWRLGLTGRNGRGKTTLLRLLAGGYQYQGSISMPVPAAYFPYSVSDKSLPAIEVAQAAAPDCELWRIKRELSLLQIPEDVHWLPFFMLSGGEQTKLLLAALFLREDQYPLIDEPTNHLDLDARKAVARYLAGKQGFLLVSHDRAFLDESVDHIMAINRNNIEIQKGSFSNYLDNKQLREQAEAAESDRLKKDIARLKESARRAADWSDATEQAKHGSRNSGLRPDRGYIGHRAAKMMKRSKAIEARREAAIEEKAKLLQNAETVDTLMLQPLTHHTKTLAAFSGVSVCYDGLAVSEAVSFTVNRGERVALSGKNGCGKSSLLKLAAATPLSYEGELHLPGGLTVSYVPQDTSALSGSLQAFAAKRGLSETQLFTMLRKLGFSRTQFEKDMAGFSEGQKKKVYLAASLCEHAHLYLWDEPLNFVDIESRLQIESLIRSSGAAMLLVEHDAAFLEAIGAQLVSVVRKNFKKI